MLFKRPSLLYSIFVTVPSVLAFGGFAVLFGAYEFVMRDKLLRQGRWGPVGTFTKLYWSYWMLWAHGIKVRASGPAVSKVNHLGGVVFVVNHQSLMDIPALIQFLPKYTSFIAKKELLKIPIFGWSAQVVGTVFIDRSRGAGNKSLSSIGNLLKAGISVVVFAEGTRSSTGHLGEFKRGAFVMAIDAQAPIVPVTILNSRFVLPKKAVAIRPGEIDIIIDDPIPTKGLTSEDRFKLSDQVRQIMVKHLDSYEKTRKNTA